MAGIWRQRPGAEAIRPARPRPAVDLGGGIWMSEGLSNSYLLATDEGRVIINCGMGFEGPVHHAAYEGVAPGPVRTIILTQGHYDHVGGVDVFREPDTEVIMQTNFDRWRDDNERLESFRARNAAFAWIDAIVAATEHARAAGIGAAPQARPEPTRTFEDRLDLEVGGRRMVLLSVPGGETTDSAAVWLPEESTVFTGNLFGPLFAHVPNLVTMRGDRYRDPLDYVASVERILELGAQRLITGHFDPVDGADLIAEELTALRDAMVWVHDRTVEGMNAGTDVWTLMTEVRVPPHLDVGEGYGKTTWNVRAIWENYSGWFHHHNTTELYPVPARSVWADLVAAAGADALCAAARTHVDAGRPVEALHLTDIVLGTDPDHLPTRRVARDATAALLEASTNFWESAWLRRRLDLLEEP